MPDDPRVVAADTVEGAIDLLDQDGWIQGDIGDAVKGRCMLGAYGDAYLAVTRIADPAHHDVDPEEEAWAMGLSGIFGQINRARKTRIEAISTWNDDPARTYEQVRDVLVDTAKELRNAP